MAVCLCKAFFGSEFEHDKRLRRRPSRHQCPAKGPPGANHIAKLGPRIPRHQWNTVCLKKTFISSYFSMIGFQGPLPSSFPVVPGLASGSCPWRERAHRGAKLGSVAIASFRIAKLSSCGRWAHHCINLFQGFPGSSHVDRERLASAKTGRSLLSELGWIFWRLFYDLCPSKVHSTHLSKKMQEWFAFASIHFKMKPFWITASLAIISPLARSSSSWSHQFPAPNYQWYHERSNCMRHFRPCVPLHPWAFSRFHSATGGLFDKMDQTFLRNQIESKIGTNWSRQSCLTEMPQPFSLVIWISPFRWVFMSCRQTESINLQR